MIKCRHCRKDALSIVARGLCWRCYNKKEIRSLYPKEFKYVPPEPEPTKEEVERLVAEQMKCLPDWWYKERETI